MYDLKCIEFPDAESQTLFTVFVFHVLPLGTAKCSVLLLYKRIFRGRVFSFLIWTMIGLMIMWTIGFCLANLLECVPVTISLVYPSGSKCVDVAMLTWVLGTSGVITDFIIMVIPWPLVWRLQMPTRQKFAVIGMFLLGALYVYHRFDRLSSRLIHDISIRTIAASLVRCIIFFTVGSIANARRDYTRKFPRV